MEKILLRAFKKQNASLIKTLFAIQNYLPTSHFLDKIATLRSLDEKRFGEKRVKDFWLEIDKTVENKWNERVECVFSTCNIEEIKELFYFAHKTNNKNILSLFKLKVCYLLQSLYKKVLELRYDLEYSSGIPLNASIYLKGVDWNLSGLMEKFLSGKWISILIKCTLLKAQFLTLLGKSEELKDLLEKQTSILIFSSEIWLVFSNCINEDGHTEEISKEFSIGLATLYENRAEAVHRALFSGENHSPYFLSVAKTLIPHFGKQFWSNFGAFLVGKKESNPERVAQMECLRDCL
ncbi:MAG: hypothetical protein SNF33_00485 [Candidatus Algichlamydia australiensis]|nr:hypothetical protein [Chlamydiales bacterium]